jgi:hypothetical protein
VERTQLGVGHRRADRGDPTRTISGVDERIHQRAVVRAVTGRLHQHVALEAEKIAQRPEFLLRRVAWRVLALGRVGESRAGPEHVAVGIDAAFGRPKRRP